MIRSINKWQLHTIFYLLTMNILLFSVDALAISSIDGIWDSNSRFVDASPGCLLNPTQLADLQANDAVLGNFTMATGLNSQAIIIDGNNTFKGLLNGNTFTYSRFLGLENVIVTLVFDNGILSGRSSSNFGFGCTLNWVINGRQLSSVNPDAPPISLWSTPLLYSQPGQFISSNSFVEPNNTPDQATPLFVNDKPLYQLLEGPDEVDWFEFRAIDGKRYTIEIPGKSIGNNINPALQLFDMTGNSLSDLITRTNSDQNITLEIILPISAIYRIRIINQPPFAKRSEVDNQYQIRIFLTDQPQQGIIKGFVLNACTQNGINEAEVSSLLGGIVNDSTLTFSTGEFGLPLNPDIYQIKSVAVNYQDETLAPIGVALENITQIRLDQKPILECNNTQATELSPILQEQQAVAVYNDKSGVLSIRDVVYGDLAFYVELTDIGNFHFELSRYYQIPGTIHANPGEYNISSGIALLPAVFAYGKTWKVQIKNSWFAHFDTQFS